MNKKPSHIPIAAESPDFETTHQKLVAYGAEILPVQEKILSLARKHGIDPSQPGSKQFLVGIALLAFEYFRQPLGFPPLRTHDEIQKAHDMLIGILLGELLIPMDLESKKILSSISSTLCWVLHHDHNDGVEKTLEYIKSVTESMGAVLLRREPDDHSHSEFPHGPTR